MVCCISCKPSSRPGSKCECISALRKERSGVVFPEEPKHGGDCKKQRSIEHESAAADQFLWVGEVMVWTFENHEKLAAHKPRQYQQNEKGIALIECRSE